MLFPCKVSPHPVRPMAPSHAPPNRSHTVKTLIPGESHFDVDLDLNSFIEHSVFSAAAAFKASDVISVLNIKSGETLLLPQSVTTAATVEVAKAVLSGLTTISPADMILTHLGVKMEDGRSLMSYGVKVGSLLCLKRRQDEQEEYAKIPVCPVTSTKRFRSCESVRRRPGKVFEWQTANALAQQQELRSVGSTAPAPDSEGHLHIFNGTVGEALLLPSIISFQDSVRLVKDVLAGVIQTPAAQIVLSWNGTILEDSRSLLSYGLTSGQCLHMRRKYARCGQSRPVQLVIEYNSGAVRPCSTRFTMPARTSELVVDVKRRIAEEIQVPPDEQRLAYTGRTLSNYHRLSDYGFEGDVVTLQVSRPSLMPPENAHHVDRTPRLISGTASEFFVVVREIGSLAGRRFRCGIAPDTDMFKLKEKLAALTGRDAAEMILIFRGRQLQEQFTASFYNMQAGDTIDLAFEGGAMPNSVRPPTTPTILPRPRTTPRPGTTSRPGTNMSSKSTSREGRTRSKPGTPATPKS